MVRYQPVTPDEWRAAHADELLPDDEAVEALPSGTRVEIVWSGGNGPWEYTIEQTAYGAQWRSDHIADDVWPQVRRAQDPIGFVGTERFHTNVRVVG